eukprot:1143811-Pelagomonas_calceolata.AAC.2
MVIYHLVLFSSYLDQERANPCILLCTNSIIKIKGTSSASTPEHIYLLQFLLQLFFIILDKAEQPTFMAEGLIPFAM